MIDPGQQARLLSEHGLEIDQRDGWLRLYQHRGRQRRLALTTVVVGVGSFTAMWLLPDDGFTASAIRFSFGSFGTCLLLLGLYLPLNTLDVRVSRRKLKRVRSWLGLVLSSQEISPTELDELAIDKGASTTSGIRTAICYRLIGKGEFGRFELVESLPDRTLVEAIRRQVLHVAGVRLSPAG